MPRIFLIYGRIIVQLDVRWVDGCHVFPFPLLGKELIIKEVLKGITRAMSAHLFQKTFLDEEKTTRSRSKQKGGSRKK